MSDPQTEQRLNDIDQRLDRLSGAVDTLVTQFLHPSVQQTLENQRVIARLIERSEQHQEWMDEDRRDLAEWRQVQVEQSQQIQSLLESARADRISANEKFEQMQSEIRQNQRLLLAGQERLERNEQRLDTNQEQIADTLAEVLSLSRRVRAVEDAA